MDISKMLRAAFSLAALCFLLPFVAVSCEDQTVRELTGIQAATGVTVEQPQMFGPPEEHRIPANPTVLLALAVGVLGALIGLRFGQIVASGLGMVGVALLLLFKFNFDSGIAEEGEGMLVAEYLVGFWGAAFFYAAAAVLGLAALRQVHAATESKRSMEVPREVGADLSRPPT